MARISTKACTTQSCLHSMLSIMDETINIGDSPVRPKKRRIYNVDTPPPEPKHETCQATRPDTESYMGMDRMPSFESSRKRAECTPLAEWIEATRMDPEVIEGVNIKQLGLKASAVHAISKDNLDDILNGNYKGVAAYE